MPGEQLTFDIFARGNAPEFFGATGAAAGAAADNVSQLGRDMAALSGIAGRLSQGLAVQQAAARGDSDAMGDLARKTAEAGAAQALLGKTAAAQLPLWSGATGRATGFGAALGLLSGHVQLFGGALSKAGLPAILATASGLHLVTEAVVETTAVLLPAAIAATAFGVAAVPAVQAVVAQMTAMNKVATALGVSMPGLSGGFERAAAAVQPQVYQLFGDALVVANQKGSAFVTLAHGAGTVLDQLAARMTAAAVSGGGLSAFMRDAIPDLARLGDLTGNLFGAVGNVLHVMPGYASVLLNVADAGSRAAEGLTRVAAPVIGVGLAAHGAVLYAGLLGTGLTFLATRGLPLVASVAEKGALGLGKIGLSGSLAAKGLAGVADGATAAAGLPWGWIGLATVGFGALVFAIASARDAAQQFNATVQQTVQDAPLMTLSTTIQAAQAKTASQLAQATSGVTRALVSQQPAIGGAASRFQTSYSPALDRAVTAQLHLTQGQQVLAAQNSLVSSRVSALGKTYGGNAAALGALNAAGITSAQILDKNKSHWAAVLVQVDATRLAYKEMGQQSGVFGSDMNVINSLASDQYTTMQQLNKAWDTYLGDITKTETSSGAAITAFRQLSKDAKGAGASFTGVSAASITLQDDFNSQLFPSVQQVIDGMRSAKAPVRDLASYMSTLLSPAVHKGALENYGMRTAIYDMAQEAGFTGPDKIGPLTRWIDRNATSLQRAANEANTYAGKLAKLPAQIGTTIAVKGSGVWSVLQGGFGVPVHRAAAGMRVTAGTTPTADDVLARVSKNETIVSAAHSAVLAPLFAAIGVPGYAAGGIAGKYAGGVPGLGPWAMTMEGRTVTAIEASVAKAAFAGMTRAARSFSAGGGFSASALQAQAYARSLLPSFGWGPGQMPPLIALWNRESGWNASARNPTSGAAGIPQDITGNFHGGYIGQVNWGEQYIKGRYGSPAAAWAHEISAGWYDSGKGYLPPGLSLALNTTGAPEPVGRPPRSGPLISFGGDMVVREQADISILSQKLGFALVSAGF